MISRFLHFLLIGVAVFWALPAFAQEADQRTDSIIVSEYLQNLGFSLKQDYTMNLSESDTENLVFRRMRWNGKELESQEYQELAVELVYGYFEQPSMVADAFDALRSTFNVGDLLFNYQEAGFDVIRNKGLSTVFIKGHFVVGFSVIDLPLQGTSGLPSKNLFNNLKQTLVQKIVVAGQPALPEFVVQFQKEASPNYAVTASFEGGIEPFYRWDLSEPNSKGLYKVVMEEKAKFLKENQKMIKVSLNDTELAPGTYRFRFVVGDRLGRGKQYDDTLEVADQPSNHSLFPLKDSTLKSTKPHQNLGANPTLSLNHQETPIVAFDLANTDLTGLTKATLVMNLEGCEFPGNGHSRRRGWNNSQAIEAYPLTQAWAEGNGYESDRRGRKGKFGSHHGSRRHGHSGNNGSGPGVTWFSPLDEEIRNNRPDGSSKWFGARTALGPRSAPSVPVRNRQTGAVEFDVTQDVLNGYYEGWLLKQKGHFQTGNFSFTSKEGGNSELAPKLLLEFSGPMAKASGSQEGTSLLGDLGFGSTGFKLRALRRRSELNNLREFLKENPTAAFVGDQVLRTVTHSNPSLCLASTVLYRTWLS